MDRRSLLALPLALPAIATAQPAWRPSRPINLVVPFAAGSGTDAVARILAELLGSELGGATITVENRAGANGVIAARAVIGSAPDGHTLFVTTNTTIHHINIAFSVDVETLRTGDAFCDDVAVNLRCRGHLTHVDGCFFCRVLSGSGHNTDQHQADNQDSARAPRQPLRARCRQRPGDHRGSSLHFAAHERHAEHQRHRVGRDTDTKTEHERRVAKRGAEQADHAAVMRCGRRRAFRQSGSQTRR